MIGKLPQGELTIAKSITITVVFFKAFPPNMAVISL